MTKEQLLDFDEKIKQLYECKILPEIDIKNLCEKVRDSNVRQKKL